MIPSMNLFTVKGLNEAGERFLGQSISYRLDDRLYLNITNSCTLECVFCPKSRSDYRLGKQDLQLSRRPEAGDIIAAVPDPAKHAEVIFSGFGEPTLRLNVLLEVARDLKARGGRVRVDTDGLANLVHDRNVLGSMAGVVDSLSVSMNAQNEAVYEQYCQPNLPGSYDAMLAFLRDATHYVPHVTATAIIGLRGVDISACRRIAEQAGADFRGRTLQVID
jgi:TatD family-associated radical SAM protein